MSKTHRICTLTIKNDIDVEYFDDGYYRPELGRSVPGWLGSRRLTRDVATLLHKWVATYPQCRRDELMVLGKALYEIAFGESGESGAARSAVRAAFEETLADCLAEDRTLRLRLVLGKDAANLAGYPWEFLFMDDPNGNGFFLAGQKTGLTLTRYVPNTDPWDDATTWDRLRILVVQSTPKIPGMTDIEGKAREFAEDLEQLDSERFDVRPVVSPTKVELGKAIADSRPHVVHFIGHGRNGRLALRKDAATLEEDRIEWEDARARGEQPPPLSEADWVDAYSASLELAGSTYERAPRRLIFLHACEGASVQETSTILGTFNDVARTLAKEPHITGVIAMQYTIGVNEAKIFASRFYTAISDGARVDDAIREARAVFAKAPLPGQQSWDSRGFGTPVSYLRREEALIIRRPDAPQGLQADEPPADRIPAAPAGKEECPNGRCEGSVVRTARPPRCRTCEEPYAPCPTPDCGHLVVAKPGWGCLHCEYVFGESSPGTEKLPLDRGLYAAAHGRSVVSRLLPTEGFELGGARRSEPSESASALPLPLPGRSANEGLVFTQGDGSFTRDDAVIRNPGISAQGIGDSEDDGD